MQGLQECEAISQTLSIFDVTWLPRMTKLVIKRITNVEDVVNNNVFRNKLADDTMDDGLSRMLRDVESGFLSEKQLQKLEKNKEGSKKYRCMWAARWAN